MRQPCEKYKSTKEPDSLIDAITRLERLLKDSTVIASAHSMLGVCRALQGHIHLAIKHLYSAMLLEPRNDNTSCTLGGLLLKEGCLQRAIALCQRTLETNPNCHQAFSLLGLITFQLGNYDLADKCFGPHISRIPIHLATFTWERCCCSMEK
jgi:tetratricopeptide (TPR) repeat protein